MRETFVCSNVTIDYVCAYFHLPNYFLRHFTLIENIIQTCPNHTCVRLMAGVQDAIVHILILLLGIVLRLHFRPKVSIVLSDAGSCMYIRVDILLLIRNEDYVN
jgi:hypothetical protein